MCVINDDTWCQWEILDKDIRPVDANLVKSTKVPLFFPSLSFHQRQWKIFFLFFFSESQGNSAKPTPDWFLSYVWTQSRISHHSFIKSTPSLTAPPLSLSTGSGFALEGFAVGQQKLLEQKNPGPLCYWASAKRPSGLLWAWAGNGSCFSSCARGHRGGALCFPSGLWSLVKVLQAPATLCLLMMMMMSSFSFRLTLKVFGLRTASTDEGQMAADIFVFH